MKETRINADQIAFLKIYRKAIDRQWIFMPEKKFWFHTRAAGFRLHHSMDGSLWTPEQIENQSSGVFVEGETVFYKPHIELHLTDGSRQTGNVLH